MKNLLFISISFLLTINGFSKTVDNVKIISNEFDSSIPEGMTVVSGVINLEDWIGEEDQEPDDLIYILADNNVIDTLYGASVRFSCLVDVNIEYLRFENIGRQVESIRGSDMRNQHELKVKIKLNNIPILAPIEDIEPIPVPVSYKPVIYLYNDTFVEFSAECIPNGDFTFTYPVIKNNQWLGTIEDNILTVEGSTYPYLFYECEHKELNYFKQDEALYGNLIKGEEIISFLETNLKILGLNSTEATDFISFWGPKLIENETIFIQFWIDDAFDQVSSLNIYPKPDNLRRIYMAASVLSKNKIPEFTIQDLNNCDSFERNGFTAVEWGGTIMNNYEF